MCEGMRDASCMGEGSVRQGLGRDEMREKTHEGEPGTEEMKVAWRSG